MWTKKERNHRDRVLEFFTWQVLLTRNMNRVGTLFSAYFISALSNLSLINLKQTSTGITPVRDFVEDIISCWCRWWDFEVLLRSSSGPLE